MCCQPSVRPTTTRRSWPEMWSGENPSRRRRATRPDALRPRILNREARSPVNPAARKERPGRLASSVVHTGAPLHASSSARGGIRGSGRPARPPTAARFGRRTTRCRTPTPARLDTEHRPAVAAAARSVAAVAARSTWQCVWSHRSKPSARCRLRFATAKVRIVMARASSADGALSRAASPASTPATYASSGTARSVGSVPGVDDPSSTAGRWSTWGVDATRNKPVRDLENGRRGAGLQACATRAKPAPHRKRPSEPDACAWRAQPPAPGMPPCRSRSAAGSPATDGHRRAASASCSVAPPRIAPRLDSPPTRRATLQDQRRLPDVRRKRIVSHTVLVEREVERTEAAVRVMEHVERSRRLQRATRSAPTGEYVSETSPPARAA